MSEGTPSDKQARLRPGSFWKEIETGRRLMILEPFVYGIGPSWTYVDSNGDSVPESERHPNWYEHYCDIFDFTVWNRFIYEEGQ